MSSVKVKIDKKAIEQKIHNMINNKNNEMQIKTNTRTGCGKMLVLNTVEKEFLKIIIDHEKNEYSFEGVDSDFPIYIMEMKDELFSKLKNAGYISSFESWVTGGWRCILTPLGKNYFEKEEEYINMSKNIDLSIGTFNVNGSNVNFGNINNSTFSIDNSYNQLEQMIEENGHNDKEELKNILEEVKDYIDNICQTKVVGKNNGLFSRIENHLEKHQWFYQSIITLIGNSILNIMQGK